MTDNNLKTRNMILLFIAATIWGSAFVAQRVGMDYVGPYTFNASRSIIGGIVLLPLVAIRNRDQKGIESTESAGSLKHPLLWGGILCGMVLFAASNFQQIGIKYTTSVGKSGFITACYIVLVPLIELGIEIYKEKYPKRLKWYPVKKTNRIVWLAVGLALIGLYLLCMTGSFSLDYADLLVLICAVLFSLHILVIDFFSPLVDGVTMSCIQFFICGVLSALFAFCLEEISLQGMLSAWMPIFYAGAFSSGIAYTLQIVGQKGVNPTIASLILSLESAISVVAAWLILGQKMSVREIAGCVVMCIAIVMVQLPDRKKE